MFKAIANVMESRRRLTKKLPLLYRYAATSTMQQLKKGLIEYILNNLYDLRYCKTIFQCKDKTDLVRYIEPLLRIHKTSNDYYKTFNDFPVDEYYYTPLFDDDTREERIIKTKSQIVLGNIAETCYFYSLRYGFDVHTLYRFMDNNKYASVTTTDDDYSFSDCSDDFDTFDAPSSCDKLCVKRSKIDRRKTMKINRSNSISHVSDHIIKLTDYNDNLRVIIAPIFPQKRTELNPGDPVDLSKYTTVKRLPFMAYSYPIYFMFDARPFHNRLPFEFKITKKIYDNMFIDDHVGRVIRTDLLLMEIYKELYNDYIDYVSDRPHKNMSCIATDIDYYLLEDIPNDVESPLSDTLTLNDSILSDTAFNDGTSDDSMTFNDGILSDTAFNSGTYDDGSHDI